uniref:PCI domain-containing protein n=1 Tax=Vannella robusta TaxID=1487602 RepID=A0A7S4HIY2_9EUKA
MSDMDEGSFGFPSDGDDFSFPDDGSDDFDFDAMGDDDYGFDYENDDSDGVEDIEVQISNCYYTSKGLMETDPKEALQGLQQILDMEPEKGEWGFKALKQIVKLQFTLGEYEKVIRSYEKLLSYVKSSVSRNLSEKAINGLIEKISTSTDPQLLEKFYDMTLNMLTETKNERFWFKTKLKVGKLKFENEEFNDLEKILEELKASCKTENGEDDMKKGTQLLEIYALEIQMYTVQKNNKKLREIYERSLVVQSAIPHPRIMAVIRECGGKMHMEEESWGEAQKDFFEAFKNYDEAGSSRRIQCLKYMVLANLLSLSEINPFGAPETASYKNDPQIVAMTDLVASYENNDIQGFEKILQNNRSTIMDDKFISMYIQDLLKNIRTQVVAKILKPYTRVNISFIAKELNITEDEVEQLLVTLILDEKISGKIDQVNKLLVVERSENNENSARFNALADWTSQVSSLSRSVVGKLNG